MLQRYQYNPIIAPTPQIKWASKKVYNCAVIKDDNNIIHMFFRAVGDDWISKLGHATSSDGKNFKVDENAVIFPEEFWEKEGVEDPRITKIGDTYYLTYTAFSHHHGAQLALATSQNLIDWQKHGPLFPNWNKGYWGRGKPNWSKAGAIFPEKIDGKYLMFFGVDGIWAAESSDLINWKIKSEEKVLKPRKYLFDKGYIEMGSPPLKTPVGWLLFYHGIERFSDHGRKPRVYRLGAALLDLENPFKILLRTTQPILQPEGSEQIGMIDILKDGFDSLKGLSEEDLNNMFIKKKLPQAIFCCGVIELNGQYLIYYSSADSKINLATISLKGIFPELNRPLIS